MIAYGVMDVILGRTFVVLVMNVSSKSCRALEGMRVTYAQEEPIFTIESAETRDFVTMTSIKLQVVQRHQDCLRSHMLVQEKQQQEATIDLRDEVNIEEKYSERSK